jgi:hypothetical protein
MVQLDLKKYTTRKKQCVSNDDYVVSMGLQWTNRKFGNIVTVY